MVATLAVDIVFTGVDLLFIDYMNGHYGRILSDKGYTFYNLYSLPDFQLFGESGLLIVAPLALILMTTSMYFLLNKTKFGIAMRAAIEDANLAKSLSIFLVHRGRIGRPCGRFLCDRLHNSTESGFVDYSDHIRRKCSGRSLEHLWRNSWWCNNRSRRDIYNRFSRCDC